MSEIATEDRSPTAAEEVAAAGEAVVEACGVHTLAWRAIRGTHDALVDRLEATFAQEGLPSLSWFDVLAALANSDEQRLRPRELVHRVVMTKSGLTRLLDRIEDAGLIERTACPDDRRGHLVVITQAGLEMYERMSPVWDRIFAETFNSVLTPEEATQISDALNRVLEVAMGGACAAQYE